MPFGDDLERADATAFAYAQDNEVPSTVDAVMADRTWGPIFYRFLGVSYDQNMVDFLNKAAAYKASPGYSAGRELYEDYVVGANAQNLGAPVRSALDAIYGPDIDPANVQLGDGNTWDAAIAEVRAILAADKFRGFQTARSRPFRMRRPPRSIGTTSSANHSSRGLPDAPGAFLGLERFWGSAVGAEVLRASIRPSFQRVVCGLLLYDHLRDRHARNPGDENRRLKRPGRVVRTFACP